MISPKNQLCLIPLYFFWAADARAAQLLFRFDWGGSDSHSLGAEARADFAAVSVRAKACTLR
jgi:hypothetical protein